MGLPESGPEQGRGPLDRARTREGRTHVDLLGFLPVILRSSRLAHRGEVSAPVLPSDRVPLEPFASWAIPFPGGRARTDDLFVSILGLRSHLDPRVCPLPPPGSSELTNQAKPIRGEATRRGYRHSRRTPRSPRP